MKHFFAAAMLALCCQVVLPFSTPFSAKAEQAEQKGLSLFGALKYRENFKHFDYVNLQAPRGGKIKLSALGGFDSLNPFIIKGRPATQLGLIYDTLMKASLDEPASQYGLIATSVEVKPTQIIFNINQEAKFHDGRPITADDVIWSFNALRAAHPFYKAYYGDVVKVKKITKHKVAFTHTKNSNKELPFILGQLPILPKHYWRNKNFNETTLTPPLGSGPYRVFKVEAGSSVTYKRVENYWGKNLPVQRGQHNIQTITVEYFGDLTVAFEAFKAKQIDFYPESRAANWAVGYRALDKKKGFKREQLLDANPAGMQAFVFNIRRKKFQDKRVRQAFNYAFDFEWSNKNFFHQAYQRTASYFEGSELAARGVPKGAARALLKPYRTQLDKQLFTKPFANPKTKGDGNTRIQLREASRLLKQAGYQVKNNRLVKDGRPLEVSFLLISPAFEKIVLAYKRQLEKLGIRAKIELVDAAQYRNRLRSYDFDIIVHTFPQSLSPGNEQRDFWSSAAAKRKGGRNLIGIQHKVVDALIEKIITAKTREELIAATQALDFVLLNEYYVVPQWFVPYHRIAYWQPLRRPRSLPKYQLGFPEIWWVQK